MSIYMVIYPDPAIADKPKLTPGISASRQGPGWRQLPLGPRKRWADPVRGVLADREFPGGGL